MASPTVDVGTGITITASISAFAAEWGDIVPPETSVGDIDVSHQLSPAREFMPSDLITNGELTGTIHFNPDTTPPVGTEETWTMGFPSGATWSFAGYMNRHSPNVPFEDKMTADVSVKVSGLITITPAA